jgi:hypothetical protein
MIRYPSWIPAAFSMIFDLNAEEKKQTKALPTQARPQPRVRLTFPTRPTPAANLPAPCTPN